VSPSAAHSPQHLLPSPPSALHTGVSRHGPPRDDGARAEAVGGPICA
jgi:hypothetical protein